MKEESNNAAIRPLYWNTHTHLKALTTKRWLTPSWKAHYIRARGKSCVLPDLINGHVAGGWCCLRGGMNYKVDREQDGLRWEGHSRVLWSLFCGSRPHIHACKYPNTNHKDDPPAINNLPPNLRLALRTFWWTVNSWLKYNMEKYIIQIGIRHDSKQQKPQK